MPGGAGIDYGDGLGGGTAVVARGASEGVTLDVSTTVPTCHNQ